MHAPRVLTVIDLATGLWQQCVHGGTRTLRPMREVSTAPPYSPPAGERNQLAKNRFAPAAAMNFRSVRRAINLSPRGKQFTFVIRFQYFSKIRFSRKTRSQAAIRRYRSDRYFQFKDSLSALPRRYTTYARN